ncbi:MAG: hypothetical protein KF687_00175 [Cyclobacteriaceae bacterium]|nr:hypothetical protein [Cyclobacteriaceae bacterium]
MRIACIVLNAWLILFVNQAFAQQEANAWISVGGGNGYSFELLVNPDRAVIAVDYTYWFKDVLSADRAKAFSVMGGYQLTPAEDKFFLSINGGPSFVSANDDQADKKSLGFIAELHSSWRFSKVVGVGFKIQLNLNGAKAFGFIGFGVQLGHLRN